MSAVLEDERDGLKGSRLVPRHDDLVEVTRDRDPARPDGPSIRVEEQRSRDDPGDPPLSDDVPDPGLEVCPDVLVEPDANPSMCSRE